MTKSRTGCFGACMAMADIFTVLYFNPLNQVSNGFDIENKNNVILIADHLKPLYYASQAHAGLIPLKALYTFHTLTSNQHRIIRHGEDRLSRALEHARSYKSTNNNATVFIIISIEYLLKNENLSLLEADNCSIPGNMTLILDLSSIILNKNEIEANKIRNLKEKLVTLGWNSRECDGHNYEDILSALDRTAADPGKPVFIFPNITSGKGIISIEDKPDWYNKIPSSNETKEFCCQLEESFLINKLRLQTHNASGNNL